MENLNRTGFSFKSKTTEGNLAKTYVTVYENGVTYWVQFVLCPEGNIDGFEKVTTRFGKVLYKKDFALKFSTLNTIRNNTIIALEKMRAKATDIL